MNLTIPRLAAALMLIAAGCSQPAPPTAPKASATPVLSTSETILGQPFDYPAADAHVTAVIVTLPPGASTGLHRHDVPLFGYMLEGELTVAYFDAADSVTEHTYLPDDALMEAIGTPHDGRNTGTGAVRILAVFIGADGIPNTVKEE
ncbi:MAG TPA: cupin domain-containing protein [Thermohalobaculum sp.]|nr:cupin domain-containing protein [Thermohalobaculum sp.]